MRKLTDNVWQRRGISWIWNKDLLSEIANASEIISLRKFLNLSKNFPEALPSNNGNAVVVSGFDGSLDLLSPPDANEWLETTLKDLIYSFQDHYTNEAALIFWLPKGENRFHVDDATDDIQWVCGPANPRDRIEVGRILWGITTDYPQRIVIQDEDNNVGLFHARIT